jgi:hypothetical protein
MIEVGTCFSSGGDAVFPGNTKISENGPANKAGILNKITIHVNSTVSDVYIGTFEHISGGTFKCRDATGNLGSLGAGIQEVDVELEIEDGDYLAMYASGGKIAYSSSGNRHGYASGNRCSPGVSTGFSMYSGKLGFCGEGPDPVTGIPYGFIM